jgi:hypothetical protein
LPPLLLQHTAYAAQGTARELPHTPEQRQGPVAVAALLPLRCLEEGTGQQ